jgi:hypothetical protein
MTQNRNLSGVAYSTATVLAKNSSAIKSYSTVFSGSYASVTGTRYTASNGSTIDTNGGGANYFPGSVAGGAATGYYA